MTTRELLDLRNWDHLPGDVGDEEEEGTQVDRMSETLMSLRCTPQVLYNRLQKPGVELTLMGCVRSLSVAFRASVWTSLGQWKKMWRRVFCIW